MSDQTASDMDGGWKQVIDDFLEDFFLFFFPAIHSLIDFREKCQLLDKELAALVAGSATGRRHVDKLIEVHWKDGRGDLLLVHVEVQAQEDSDFAGRMFVYNSRISDRYARPVVSLALLVDADPTFRPHEYYRAVAGCELRFTFPVVKLLDYKTQEELRGDSNPFAIASLVQLRKLQAGRNVQHRFRYKVALAWELYGRDYSPDYVLKLLRFMDYILTLPAAMVEQYRGELQRIEEKLKMPYLTTFEQKAMEKGIEKGIEKGLEQGIVQGIEQGIEKGIELGIRQGIVDALRQTLTVRFGEVPESLLESIQQTKSVEELQRLHKLALTIASVDELPV